MLAIFSLVLLNLSTLFGFSPGVEPQIRHLQTGPSLRKTPVAVHFLVQKGWTNPICLINSGGVQPCLEPLAGPRPRPSAEVMASLAQAAMEKLPRFERRSLFFLCVCVCVFLRMRAFYLGQWGGCVPFFCCWLHLVKPTCFIVFPWLVLKGIYHYWNLCGDSFVVGLNFPPTDRHGSAQTPLERLITCSGKGPNVHFHCSGRVRHSDPRGGPSIFGSVIAHPCAARWIVAA